MRVRQERYFKKCHACGTIWEGLGQPRPRQICGGCGSYLHTCMNCHHFDSDLTHACTLPHTAFVGPRDALNYCDDFKMVNARLKAIEARTQRARNVWDQLFRK